MTSTRVFEKVHGDVEGAHQARSVRRRSAMGQNFASVPMRGFVVVPARIFQSVPKGTPELRASCCSSAWLIARSRFFTDSSEGI